MEFKILLNIFRSFENVMMKFQLIITKFWFQLLSLNEIVANDATLPL